MAMANPPSGIGAALYQAMPKERLHSTRRLRGALPHGSLLDVRPASSRSASSDNRSTISLVTTPPRRGKTYQPFVRTAPAGPDDGAESLVLINARRASSDRTLPAVFRSLRASALAASSTSSSISSVVRMHPL